jgi:catechol 2,3-dioxygenase-like lactoylglutathione lyase family enzyme
MNLNQITIPVSNIARSIVFYQNLGLKLIVKSTHYVRFECSQGDSTFSLHEVDSVESNHETWIYFEVEDVDRKVRELAENGFIFEEMPEDKPWLWRESRIKDPDNNQLIIYSAAENRKNPPWRI